MKLIATAAVNVEKCLVCGEDHSHVETYRVVAELSTGRHELLGFICPNHRGAVAALPGVSYE